MKYGYFDDKAKEYVINTPATPLPWINYLGSERFFTLVSNTAGGYSFYRDARLRRITRYRYNAAPLDADGFHIYVRENDAVWNPGWQPVQTETDSYECRHGLGYTTVTGSRNGLKVSQEMLVADASDALLIRVTAANQTAQTKEFRLFFYTEFCLWDAMDDASNFQRNYSTGEVELMEKAIIHKTEYRERRDHYALLWSSEKPDGMETRREAFLGVYGSPAKPEAVLRGQLENGQAHGWQPAGAMQFDLCLEAGEEKSILLGLGYIENPKKKWEKDGQKGGAVNKERAEVLMKRFADPSSYDCEKEKLKNKWQELLGSFVLEAEDERLTRMVNCWNPYQCMVTFNMSRSASYYESGLGRGMGFRDSCQDLFGFVQMIPERARERILDIAATQFEDGRAYHQYQPLTKKGNLAVGSGFNDDPLWLIAAADAYLKETGDFSILSEQVPFDNDETKKEPLLEHLRRSFRYIVEHTGPHGLPLIGRADWNDCLNLNCFSEKPGESFQTTGSSEGSVAESVFIGGMFVLYGRSYAGILRHIGLEEEAEACLAETEKMSRTVLREGWDGEWFLRAYDAFSKPLGTKKAEEGKILLEPQGMCVMAGIGLETGEAEQALRSVEKYLDTDYGVALLDPPFTYYRPEYGEITSYPESYKENASVFCHSNSWAIAAETELGHGDRAYELYRKITPAFIEDISEIHRTEPYVYSQMVAGKKGYPPGEAKNSWLTGTAAWMYRSVTQSILGIKPELDGLVIDPCIPEDLKEYTVSRRYRGAVYHIRVMNPDRHQKGVREIRVNGERIPGNRLPVICSGGTCEVEVLL